MRSYQQELEELRNKEMQSALIKKMEDYVQNNLMKQISDISKKQLMEYTKSQAEQSQETLKETMS